MQTQPMSKGGVNRDEIGGQYGEVAQHRSSQRYGAIRRPSYRADILPEKFFWVEL